MDSDDYYSCLFGQLTIQGPLLYPVIAAAIAVILLFVSSVLSASEVAFFSLTNEEATEINEERTKADQWIARLLTQLEPLLSSLQVSAVFINVAVIMLCLYAFGCFFELSAMPLAGFLVLLVAFIALLLLFGEILPKLYVQSRALRFVRFSVPFVRLVYAVCGPLGKLASSSFMVNKAAGKKKRDISVDDLSKALALTSGEMAEEKDMLADIIKFYHKTANEIMTSRLDMEDIDIKSSFHAVLHFIVQSGYSRIPVYAVSEDTIKGILYIKDLLPYIDKPDTFRWQSLIRPAYFVPETKKIDDLLEEFRTNKIHMAIVVDEFGGTSGLVTMEDILEEIVGEISDEYDEEERQFILLNDGNIIFEAKIPLNDFFRVIGSTGSEFGKLTEEVETLAGLLLEIKGGFPQRREIIDFKDYRFQILEVDERRILKVKFSLLNRGEEESENGESKE